MILNRLSTIFLFLAMFSQMVLGSPKSPYKMGLYGADIPALMLGKYQSQLGNIDSFDDGRDVDAQKRSDARYDYMMNLLGRGFPLVLRGSSLVNSVPMVRQRKGSMKTKLRFG